MKKKRILCALFVAVMIVALGCDDNDDGGVVSSGVNSSKQLDELSDDEARRICEEFASAPGEVFEKEALCRFASFSAGRVANNSSNICETTYDLCMQSGLTDAASIIPGFLGNLVDCNPNGNNNGHESDECNATVGEVEQCANDVIAAYKSVINQMNCDNLGTIDWPDKPFSCEVIEGKCP